jgi:hypothetical protein
MVAWYLADGLPASEVWSLLLAPYLFRSRRAEGFLGAPASRRLLIKKQKRNRLVAGGTPALPGVLRTGGSRERPEGVEPAPDLPLPPPETCSVFVGRMK